MGGDEEEDKSNKGDFDVIPISIVFGVQKQKGIDVYLRNNKRPLYFFPFRIGVDESNYQE